ncbi:MAG: hypothetical protein DI539_04770 [Flavobacterium psychrophilum]|nr:MAG: hypothetical protein DI539_04770 [Flavobacterium psychrophilum]
MKPLSELINTQEPGWELVQTWISEAKNSIEVLPANSKNAEEALYNTQVTTRSPMGAIVYVTGGILIDNGWIRILGSGSEKLNRSLPDWNKGKAYDDFGKGAPFLLIADDAIGGFFVLNGGGLGSDLGKIYYLAPDTLEYEPLDLTYSDFLYFCFNNDLDQFYEGYRWKSWKKDMTELKGNEVFSFYPYLWTEEGKDINKTTRNKVSVEEYYNLTLDFRKQLNIK